MPNVWRALSGVVNAQTHIGINRIWLKSVWFWACCMNVVCFADGPGATTLPAAGWGTALLEVRPCLYMPYKKPSAFNAAFALFCVMLQATQYAATQ